MNRLVCNICVVIPICRITSYNVCYTKLLRNLSYVDEKLKSVTSNDDYQNGDIDTRVELLQPILDQLLIEERIVEYHLELKGSRPNVSIKYAGGGNGCILLKEFTKDEN